MKIFDVRMMTCGTWDTVKEVAVNDEACPTGLSLLDILGKVFRYGQNEFAIEGTNKTLPSVSAGDIIEVPVDNNNKEYHMVAACGFVKVTDVKLEMLKTATKPMGYGYAYGFVEGDTNE